ncbi:hypothetical protein ACZ90_11460 [Streptomyces albus subsp. albus]|nr:hypothetical protein ACZ90_11460 [Streptomyces albus subsp. albus]
MTAVVQARIPETEIEHHEVGMLVQHRCEHGRKPLGVPHLRGFGLRVHGEHPMPARDRRAHVLGNVRRTLEQVGRAREVLDSERVVDSPRDSKIVVDIVLAGARFDLVIKRVVVTDRPLRRHSLQKSVDPMTVPRVERQQEIDRAHLRDDGVGLEYVAVIVVDPRFAQLP